MMLYKFDRLKAKMDEWEFPDIQNGNSFKLIREDFKKAYQKDLIEFRENGIYYVKDGKEHRGYMYMPRYKISQFGHASRAHVTKCSVISDFLDRGIFSSNYIFSNSQTNDITDSINGNIHKDEVLQLCSQCRNIIFENIADTEDFYNSLNVEEKKNTTTEVDIFGYVRNWRNISKQYRLSVNYTCENCGWNTDSKYDRRFLHTHHINGDKTDNRALNLQCLCVECHSEVDALHSKNFEKDRLIKIVEAFKRKYPRKDKDN